MAPTYVTKANESEVRKTLYPQNYPRLPVKAKFVPGDLVRTQKEKNPFSKGYLSNGTEEIFTVGKLLPRERTMYQLVDSTGELVVGSFYEPELQKVTKSRADVYKLEKVLKRRHRGCSTECLVKWHGYPISASTWAPERDIVSV